ncbi:hypothetical protein Tco_0455053 [Tanacetum coccineum]
MSVLPDDQMNSVINCLTAKSTWDNLILYHEGPFDVKESSVMDLKYVTTPSYLKKKKSLVTATPLSTAFFSTSIVQDFQDSLDDEEDTRSRLVAEAYEWDKEDVSSDDNEMTEVKVIMALADDENVVVNKESVRNGEWVKISMRKVHTLLEMEDNDDRKYFIDYLCIDL